MHHLKHRSGSPHSRSDPGMILVEDFELGHFEVGNFDQKMTLFSAIMSICSPLGDDRARAQTKAKTSSYCMAKM